MTADSTAPPSGGPAQEGTTRKAASIFLIVIAGICLFVGNVFLWVNTTLFDNDEFSTTVSDVLERDDVQARIAEVLTAQVLQSSDLQQRLEQDFPERAQFLVPLIRAQLEPAIQQVAERVLASDRAQGAMDTAIAAMHQQVLDLLENNKKRLKVEGGAIVLDLGGSLSGITNRLNISAGGQQGGANGAGQIVLMKNVNGLKQASSLVQNRVAIAAAFMVAAVVLFALAILVRRDHRRGFELMGYAVVAVGLLTIIVLFLSNLLLQSQAEQRTVARELVRGLEANLRWQSMGLAVLGLCIALLGNLRVRGWLARSETQTAAAVESFGVVRAAVIGLGGAAAVLLLVQ